MTPDQEATPPSGRMSRGVHTCNCLGPFCDCRKRTNRKRGPRSNRIPVKLPMFMLMLLCIIALASAADLPPVVTVVEHQATTFSLDLCKLAKCPAWLAMAHAPAHKYLCTYPCKTWSNVFANTDSNGYVCNTNVEAGRWIITQTYSPPSACAADPFACNGVRITVSCPRMTESGLYSIGVDSRGTDTLGVFTLKVVKPNSQTHVPILFPAVVNPSDEVLPTIPTMTYQESNDLVDTISFETGFYDGNIWIRWATYTAQQHSKSDCYVCATGRPGLITSPFPLSASSPGNPTKCLWETQSHNDPACTDFNLMFPRPKHLSYPPPSRYVPGQYECFSARRQTRGKTRSRGVFPFCEITWIMNDNDTTTVIGPKPNTNQVPILSQFNPSPRTDVWWACGPRIKMTQKLPDDWTGTCAPVMLVMPTAIGIPSGVPSPISSATRAKRDLSSPLGSFDNHIYIDAIGVPRGVPDEFKARNQIAAGFESLFLWPTINKNVDWINYIYYNQQRFVNHTHDAIKGLAEQLDATSLMTWQNRLALDMLLAEKGGVGVMFDDACCTFIPNNTAPDGSVTKALEGLKSLKHELATNSGVDTSITGWLDSAFGKWKLFALTVLGSLISVAGMFGLCGCCIIPCLRSLMIRSIDRSINTTLIANSLNETETLTTGLDSDSDSLFDDSGL